MQEKKFEEEFVCHCKKKCTNNVSIELRKRLFNQYWSMGSFVGRCALLISCIDQKRLPETRNKYSIFGIEVCKRGLKRTLQINENRLSLALDKHLHSESLADGTGKTTGGRNVLPLSKREAVYRRHISSFPKYVSHYTRNQTDSKFLSPNLSLSKMYELYKQQCAGIPVSKSFYNRIFYDYFNLRFKSPKKHTCKKCDLFAAKVTDANPFTRLVLEYRHDTHLKLADTLQTQMKQDLERAKSEPELEVISYDMQKILVWPNPKCRQASFTINDN